MDGRGQQTSTVQPCHKIMSRVLYEHDCMLLMVHLQLDSELLFSGLLTKTNGQMSK